MSDTITRVNAGAAALTKSDMVARQQEAKRLAAVDTAYVAVQSAAKMLSVAPRTTATLPADLVAASRTCLSTETGRSGTSLFEVGFAPTLKLQVLCRSNFSQDFQYRTKALTFLQAQEAVRTAPEFLEVVAGALEQANKDLAKYKEGGESPSPAPAPSGGIDFEVTVTKGP